MSDTEDKMSYYPVLLKLNGKTALVIGGGKVAERKIETLLEYGALIYIISKGLTDKLNKLVEDGYVKHLGEEFRDQYLDGAFLVIAATDDKKLNQKISESTRKRGVLINVVDQPNDCNFIVPSIVRRGDLIIAVSTSGKSPALAKKIREELETQFGTKYETFLLMMGRLRKSILSKGLSHKENTQVFHKIVDSHIMDALNKKDWAEVESIIRQILPWDLDIKDMLKDL